MKRILVIQLHRFGDLLQTTPIFHGLKKKFPESYIAVVPQRDFVEILIGNPYINKIFPFDKGGLMREIQWKGVSLKESYDKIHDFIEVLREHNFDLIINVGTDDLSALIAYLLKVKDTKGVAYAADGFRYHRHKWMIYLFAVLKHRIYNSFNVVDLHLGVGEVPFGKWPVLLPLDAESQAFGKKFCAENGITDNDFVVGFQLGASREYKTWPVKYFARLGDELIRNEDAKIILFGHPLEAKLGEDICDLMHNKPINAIGKTDIKQLGAMLQRCQYLVSNDTLTIHVASAVGTKVIGIYISTSMVHDTAPYGEGHLLLQTNLCCLPCNETTLCEEIRCKDLISPEMVLSALKIDRLHGRDGGFEHVSTLYPDLLAPFKTADLFTTRFDCDGMLECVPITKRPLTDTDVLRYCYRFFWKGYLGVARRLFNVDDFWNEVNNRYIIETPPIDLKKHIQSFEKLSTLCNSGISQISQGLDPAVLSKKIVDIDGKVLGIEGGASFLTNLYFIEKTNMAEDVTSITKRNILELYMRTHRNASIMKGMLTDVRKFFMKRPCRPVGTKGG